MAIAGRFIGDHALGAVGATTFLVNGFINFLVGISVGANVVISRYFGMKDPKRANCALHTAIMLGAIGGVLLSGLGLYTAEFAMAVLDTPKDLKPMSVEYLRIYYLGLPIMSVFNLCTAALRSVGDTKNPLYFLGFAGCCNLGLNVLFVVVLKIGVAGVALGTVLSQLLACMLILKLLSKGHAGLKFQIGQAGNGGVDAKRSEHRNKHRGNDQELGSSTGNEEIDQGAQDREQDQQGQSVEVRCTQESFTLHGNDGANFAGVERVDQLRGKEEHDQDGADRTHALAHHLGDVSAVLNSAAAEARSHSPLFCRIK